MKKHFLQKIILTTALAAMGLVSFAQTQYATNPAISGAVTPQVVRNTSPITYTVDNPDGANATFTWTVTGGTIYVGGIPKTSPYTAASANSIQVKWDATNPSSVNNGTIKVSKIVNHGDGNNCSSVDQEVDVQSWVAPTVKVNTSAFSVCSGTNLSAYPIDLVFTGKPNYGYTWELIDSKGNVKASSTSDQSSANASAQVAVDYAVTSTSSASETYTFKITNMYDGFTTPVSGDYSTASVAITVYAIPTIGSVSSDVSLQSR